jgi:hypothetical protein
VSRRLIITGVAVAAVAGAVVPALAQTGPSSPVTVTTDTSNGVSAEVWVNGQPGVGGSVTPDGKACVGVSLQLPVCADASAVVATVEQSVSVQQPDLPVTVTHDSSNGVSVGVAAGSQPLVGASVSPDGTACVGFSKQLPVCAGGPINAPQSRQSLPIPPAGVYRDDYGTTVYAGDVGVRATNDGRVCPQVSTQLWPCVGGDG